MNERITVLNIIYFRPNTGGAACIFNGAKKCICIFVTIDYKNITDIKSYIKLVDNNLYAASKLELFDLK